MAGTRTRPNANPILARMRDDFGSDSWGVVMGWSFGVAEVLYVAGETVPPEMGFHPSPFLDTADPDTAPEEYPDEMVWQMLREFGEVTVTELQTAGKCLARYAEWLKADGQAY